MPDLTRADRRRCRPPLPLAVLSAALAHVHLAFAQPAPPVAAVAKPVEEETMLVLRPTRQLPEALPKADRKEFPALVDGDRISGRTDLETVVEGNAILRKADTSIRADRLTYDRSTDVAEATGHVRINQAGNVYEGPKLQLKLETFEGYFNEVRYSFLARGGYGAADRVDFLDENRAISYQATYTTCLREDYPGWIPAWILRAASLKTDTEENTGIATDAQLSFMGISTPPLPSLSFPLTDARKSGLLPPIVGLGSTNGFELTLPYYWNIAPNRDATLTPTLMTKRGVNIGGEFRYLEEKYHGEVRADYMPSDALRKHDRWGVWTRHDQDFSASAKALGFDAFNGYLTVNRVSDDDYWRDFNRTPSFTQRLLNSEAGLNWSLGDFSGVVRALTYQTLQDPASPIVPPYDRLPQLTANYTKLDWNGFDFSFSGDYTRFHGDPVVQHQPNAERIFGLAQLSRPFLTPGSFLIPKLQLHARSYQFDESLSNGRTSAQSVVPTFSLDSGLIFERDATYFGRAFRQTLEPRAFYVYTPFRDQSTLPIYDTAQNDFNFATVYTENAFSGNDRISDSQLLTLGVSSRLIDPDTGIEAVRLGVAQRIRFKDQNVTMPGVAPVTDRVSDILVGGQINWSPLWSVTGSVQYNPDTRRSERTTFGGRYNPGPYRNISMAYRYQAETSPGANNGNRSLDVGWQWPINDLWGDKGVDLGPGKGQGGGRWYAVGRFNYSLEDNKLTDGVIGLEYDGCCWIGRAVLERLSTGQATATTRLMLQIEFVGFASIGTSPMRTLQQNIQRYQPLRLPVPGPSRFTNYD